MDSTLVHTQSTWNNYRTRIHIGTGTLMLVATLAGTCVCMWWLIKRGLLIVEVGDVYVRAKIGTLVLWYSIEPHAAGWFFNTLYNCGNECRIHMIPRTHYMKLGDWTW